MSDEIKQAIQGMMGMSPIDTTNEILNLWTELYFSKVLIMNILSLNKLLNNEVDINKLVEKSRIDAREQVLKRFPNMGITFQDMRKKENKEQTEVKN